MTKIKNMFILVGGILLAILYIIIKRDARNDVEKIVIKSKIKRRKNTIETLSKKRDLLKREIRRDVPNVENAKKKLENVEADREKMKSKIESEIKDMNDEELASELGSLLDSL